MRAPAQSALSRVGVPVSAIVSFALAQRQAIYVLVGVLLIAGVVAATHLPEQIYPTLSFSRVLVIAQNGDLAPPLVQSGISRPLEQQLAAVLGLQQLRVNSTQGTAAISLTFDPHVANINIALQRVSTAVSSVEGSLPKGTTVSIQEVDPSIYPVVGYALTSDRLSSMQLREAAQYQIRPQLLGLPGVSLVGVAGGDEREYLVSVDPHRLAAAHIAVDQLTTAISQANTVTSVGHMDNHYIRSTIVAMGQAHDASDIAKIVVATVDGTPITVGMLAAVVEAPAPMLWGATTQGRKAVLLNVFAQPGASFVGVARTADDAMRAITAKTSDIHASRFWNQGALVADAISSLRDAILIGLVLSTLVLFAFLRNGPSTIVAAVVIPASIVIAFAVLEPLGQSLNLMTLGGLAIGVGLIIDDAIVVVENVYRHLGAGEQSRVAIPAAVSEIAVPMISSTLTTIVVFAPLALLSGVAGAFFRALAIALAVALVISLMLALVVAPNIASQFLHLPRLRVSTTLGRMQQRYEKALRWALLRRTVVLGGAGVVLAVTILLATRLGTDFLPALDEGAFELEFRLPAGTSLAETQRVAGQIEEIVQLDPAVASEATLVGLTFAATDTPGGVNSGILRATLKRKGGRAPIDAVMGRIQDRVHSIAPIVQGSSKQLLADMLNELSSTAAPIEIRVFGPQQAILVPLATDIASRIAQVPGVSGAFSGVILHNPSLVVTATPAAGAFGVTSWQLVASEAVAYGGSIVSSIIQPPRTIPIRVRYDLPLDPTLAQVQSVPIVTPSGDIQPISRLATFQQSPPQSEVNELNGRQYLSVTAQISGRNLGAVVTGIKQRLASLRVPAGYSTEIAGAYALQNQSFGQFSFALALSVALVFLVMLIQFRSFLQPLAILATIPLALFGAVLALFVTRISLNVSSLMGVILLVGLVVKNGILLLEYAHRRQERGEPVAEALVYAARVRLRPILMTTLTALLGMAPLAFAFGSGSELLQPLAIAVIGGLTFSTLFTLIVIPVLYDALIELAGRKPTPPRLYAMTRPVITLIVGALYLAGCDADRDGDRAAQRTPTARTAPTRTTVPVRTAVVRLEEIPVIITASGSVSGGANAQASLAFPEAGRIAGLDVKVGQSVRAGQVLARLDAGPFEADAAQARAALAASQANYAKILAGARPQQVAQVNAQIQSAQMQLALARTKLARQQKLFQFGIVARADVETADAAVASARSQLRVLQEQQSAQTRPFAPDVASARAGVAQAQAVLAAAQQKITYATLTAPFSGVVVGRLHNDGETVDQTTPVVQIARDHDTVFTANASPQDAQRLHVGARAKVQAQGTDEIVDGTVVAINPQQTSTARSVPVLIRLSSGGVAFGPGAYGTASIVVGAQRALVLPSTAVVADPTTGTTQVFRKDGQAYEPVSVTVSRQIGSRTAIRSAQLHQGDVVVAQGSYELLAPPQSAPTDTDGK
jgi:CzcA family heavy metal efflux pump